MNKKIFIIILLSLTVQSISVTAQKAVKDNLKDWPKGASPQEIGKKVALRFLSLPHSNNGKSTPPLFISYPEVCTWYGALTFAKYSKDKGLTASLTDRFQPFFDKEANLIHPPTHVDFTVFGAVPFELYIETKDTKYLDMAKKFADNQWDAPEKANATPQALQYMQQGYSWQTRLWIDDMFMITSVQAQAYRATGNQKYIDRAAKEMVFYLENLQRPNGLFYHSDDVPFYWGRGDGWMAAGMAELLRSLPVNNPYRDRIMKGYKLMMSSLLKYQTKDGMWRQLIDDDQSWPETSCTGMFAYAMITGVKNNWLDNDTYSAASRKAWLKLITYLDENADIHEVCEGTNKENDRNYYLTRKRNIGDNHGQAPILWCTTALLRPN
jgi:unsaturated rhamnogalacturonyl hydrolase